MISVTTRPYEENSSLASTVNQSYIKSFVIFRDTSVFGLCLAFVYGISVLLVLTIAKIVSLPAKHRERMLDIAPFLLSAPFWASVILSALDLFPISGLTFLDSIFWSIVAWALFISVSTTFATILCTIRFACRRQAPSATEETSSDYEPKTLEEALSLVLGEGLITTSPLPSPSLYNILSESPREEGNTEHSSRPLLCSITRCWSDGVGAYSTASV